MVSLSYDSGNTQMSASIPVTPIPSTPCLAKIWHLLQTLHVLLFFVYFFAYRDI